MDGFRHILERPIFLVAGVVFAVVVEEYLETQSIELENGLIFTFAVLIVLSTFYVSKSGKTLTQLVEQELSIFGEKLARHNDKIEDKVEIIDQRIDRTMKAIGTSFEYVNDRWVRGELREGTVFKRVMEIVNTAQEEILISGYSDKKFDRSLLEVQNSSEVEETNRTWRLQYLTAIEELLNKRQDKFFTYFRIIQMPDTNIDLTSETLGEVEFNHCHEVLQIRERTRNPSIKIMKMQTERISTFVIVDKTYLILSDIGTRMTNQGEGEYLAGVFIIEDLTGSVVEGFRDYFMKELFADAQPIELSQLFISGGGSSL
ncbi:hypothetical protein [Candidatus Leptofilum sp.]|uniref:hypothetical protein n=1 Tax=Candidatus Leptofilum sp. TaxID=3241576 RepID=UPI003B5AF615